MTLDPLSTAVETGATTTLRARLDRALTAGHTLEIYDLDNPLNVVASCSSGTDCARTVSKASADVSRFQAVVRRSDDISRPATAPISMSQVATVSARPFVTTIVADPALVDAGGTTTLTATVNQPLSAAPGAYSTETAQLLIMDHYGVPLGACEMSSCRWQATPQGPGPFTYRALVRASGAIKPDTLSDWVKRVIVRAGLHDPKGKPLFHLHDLRRTAATLAREQGVSIEVIRDQLGHAHERMTNRHYIRARSNPRLAEFFDAMDAVAAGELGGSRCCRV